MSQLSTPSVFPLETGVASDIPGIDSVPSYENAVSQYPPFDPEDPPQRPKTTSDKVTTVIIIITVLLIVFALVLLFVFLNKKNTIIISQESFYGRPITIKNEQEVYVGLSYFAYFNPVNVFFNVATVDYRKRDPPTRWRLEESSIEGGFVIKSAFTGGLLFINGVSYGTTYPPFYNITSGTPTLDNILLPADYGAYAIVGGNTIYEGLVLGPDYLLGQLPENVGGVGFPFNESRTVFELEPAGPKKALGTPFYIRLKLNPTYYLSEIPPRPWGADDGFADFMEVRSVVYVTTNKQIWYLS